MERVKKITKEGEKMGRLFKNEIGITLIALVITIIVLLILAGVSIAMLTGDNGILTQANNAKIEQSHAAVKEGISLAYSEYQIEQKTAKVASTETISIPAKEEKSLAEPSTTFLSFLLNKQYVIDSGGTINVKNLTGSKQALGNGEGISDIYKVEGQENNYVVNYYDKNGTPQEIWSVAGSSTEAGDEGEVTLDPDTGKEALILEYQVSAEDTIELPYDLEWVEFPNGMDNGPVVNDAVFDFEVDWGDGTKESGITNANISEKAIHQYQSEGTYDIKITGTYEVISRNYKIDSENYEYTDRKGVEKLVKVKQWGTTGLKNVGLYGLQNLTEIVTPTESSFKDLTAVTFSASGIKNIPDKLFANCKNITDLNSCFQECTNLTIIGNYAFANCTGVKSFRDDFRELESLTTIGNYVFANCSNVESFEGCFSGCTNLTTIGDYAFSNCNNVKYFSYTFVYCSNLTTIGENIFKGCDNVESYAGTFGECSKLGGKAPELWLTGTNSKENDYIGTPNGVGCFFGCNLLDNYEEIPAYWKEEMPS